MAANKGKFKKGDLIMAPFAYKTGCYEHDPYPYKKGSNIPFFLAFVNSDRLSMPNYTGKTLYKIVWLDKWPRTFLGWPEDDGLVIRDNYYWHLYDKFGLGMAHKWKGSLKDLASLFLIGRITQAMASEALKYATV